MKRNFFYSKVEISHVLIDSTLNIRALEIEGNKIYNASSKGKIYSFESSKPDLIDVEQYKSDIDSVFFPNFRSMSIVNQDIYTITIGNPALLFKNGKVVYREINKKVFYDSAVRFLPFLELEDLNEDQVGIRPKLQKPGDPFRDFIITNENDKGYKNLINLLGIESPGLTSCLAIAKYVENQILN